MFGNNYGNSSYGSNSSTFGSFDRINVNTRIKSFYNDKACLALSFWNDNLSIKINPILTIGFDGKRQYDYNRRGNTTITAEKCVALRQKIDELIMPHLSEIARGEYDGTVAISTIAGGPSSCAVGVGVKKDENGISNISVTIYGGVDSNGRALKDATYTYIFSKTEIIEDYDPDTGAGTKTNVEAEFQFFYDKLKTIADMFGTAAHSDKSDSAGSAKFGGRNFGTDNGGFQNSFGSTTQPQQTQGTPSTYSAPVSDFNSGLPF
jgi:hypothetical protein